MAGSGALVQALVLASVVASSQTSLGPGDTFTHAGLTPAEIREVTGVVERSAYDTPESWTLELRVRRMMLGESAGLIVQGSHLLCGATGNCQIFVLRHSSGHWVSLFPDGHQVIAETFAFGPGAAHGVPDLTVSSNLGAAAERRVTFRFDGRFYR